MRILLELFRIYFIFWFLGVIGYQIINNIYLKNGVNNNYSWFGMVAVLILLFVLYRNKLQFSGWYQGKNMNKLPESISKGLIIISIFLLVLPLVLGLLLV